MPMTPHPVQSRHSPFTTYGLQAGAIAVWPLIPGLAMFGVAFGVMAKSAGLNSFEAVLMSGWVHAGGAQMAALQAWADPVPLLAVFLTTLAMNARYLLLGASLRPWFDRLPVYQSSPSLFVMGDGNWAMAVREQSQGRDDAAFLLGSGLVMWMTWISSTAAGHAFGQILGQPEIWGLDFMLAAYFATIAVGFLRNARDAWPLIVSVLAAVVFERMVPGGWYILAGALAGSIAGAVRHAR
jgi:branched chain amino acid efflux pump